MATEVRLYTVNRGMMDSWLTAFKEKIMPTSAQYGIRIHAAWVNRPQNEFIWVRQFTDAADRETKLQAFNDERTRTGVVLGQTVAKMEITEVEVASVPAMT